MEYFLWYVLILLVIFLVLYIFDFIRKDKKDNLGLAKSFQYIVAKYDLNMDKKRVRTLSKIIVFVNSFIISIPFTLVLFLEINYVLSLVVSFVIFIILILSLYNLVGYVLKKKGW